MNWIPRTKSWPTAAAASVQRRRWIFCARPVSARFTICTEAFSPGPRKWIRRFRAISGQRVGLNSFALACVSPFAPLSLNRQQKVPIGFRYGGILGCHKSYNFQQRPTARGRRLLGRGSRWQGIRAGRANRGIVLPVRAYGKFALLRWVAQAAELRFGRRSPRFTPKTLRNTDSGQFETVSA